MLPTLRDTQVPQDQANTRRSSGPLVQQELQDQSRTLLHYTNATRAANVKHHSYSYTPGAVVAKANVQPLVLPLLHTSRTSVKNVEPPNTSPKSNDAYSGNSKRDTKHQRPDAMHPGNNLLSSAFNSKTTRPSFVKSILKEVVAFPGPAFRGSS